MIASSATPPQAYRIQSVKALTKFANSNEASRLLQRLVCATQALLVRRKWSVQLLTEFLPKGAGLLGLNVNRGTKIMIRLREHNNNDTFLPWESLLGTLVHELVHIEISSHSFEFYSLVDKLCDEVQSDGLRLPSAAPSAAPFAWENGRRLGGKAAPTLSSARELSADAAIKRSRADGVGGQRLGGEVAEWKTLSKQQLMARAAERRLQDSVGCGETISLEEDEELGRNTHVVDLSEMEFCQPCVPVDLRAPRSSTPSPVVVVSLLEDASPPRKRSTTEVIDLT